jgi:hypothetical protein
MYQTTKNPLKISHKYPRPPLLQLKFILLTIFFHLDEGIRDPIAERHICPECSHTIRRNIYISNT